MSSRFHALYPLSWYNLCMDWDNSNSPETNPPDYYSALEAANSIRKLAKLESIVEMGSLVLLWVGNVFITRLIAELAMGPWLIDSPEPNPFKLIYNCLPIVYGLLAASTLYVVVVNVSGKLNILQSLSASGLVQNLAEGQLDTSEITLNTPVFMHHLARTPQPDIKSQLQHVANHLDWYLAAPAPYYPNAVPILLLVIILLTGILFPSASRFLQFFGSQTICLVFLCTYAKNTVMRRLFADYITANLDLFKAPADTTS